MSIRESINDRPVVGACIAVALAAVAVVMGYKLYPHPAYSMDVGTSYYSDDDGASYYKDSMFNFPPHDHDGKTAELALVFSNGDVNFVGLLERYTPEAKKQLEDEYAKVHGSGEPMISFDNLLRSKAIQQDGMEVKLPGPGNTWYLRSTNPQLKVKSPNNSPCWIIPP